MSKPFWDYQQPEFYRFNSDSTFLLEEVSTLVKKTAPRSILDVGAGCGILGLELAQKFPEVLQSVTLLEPLLDFRPYLLANIQEIMTRAASVSFHQVEESILSFKGDGYDLIVSNPPYFLSDRGRVSPNLLKSHCRTFKNCTPQEFFQAMQKQLKPEGMGFFLGHSDVWGEGDWEIIAKFRDVSLYRFFSVSNCR